MCYGCYLEAGSPIPTLEARILGKMLREVSDNGGCHIVREDWNLEQEHIDFCIEQPDTTEREKEIMEALKELTEEQRYAAMAVADGFV